MALYDIVSGNTAAASDVEQLVNIFNGKHDIGQITFAPQISAPTSSSFSLASQSGSSLGVGAYNYEFTYVTGQYKSDGTTLVQTGETNVSSNLSITTTSGNTNVLITLPTSGFATSCIAINIYRTSVGGSDYKLVATVKPGSANYTDSTADASRGSQTPPSSNTTGTSINSMGNPHSVGVGSVSNQSLTASTDNGISLQSNGLGLAGDSAWSTSTWTCPQAGLYLINMNMYVTLPTGSGCTFSLYVNGSLTNYMSEYWNSSTGTQVFGGAGMAVKKLNAGDALRFYVNPTVATTLQGQYSRIHILKIG